MSLPNRFPRHADVPGLTARLAALHSGAPQVIASANVGCIAHLQAGSDTPVRHWVELFDERMRD